ncbi:ANTAR domain-containing protein [Arthrobacter oryzae]|uniref:ANTAR domain-containing protein n=1 Tax=Arthrobacter oryzae TaxID=409290 RepID=UPI00273C64C3|nr:ANTAR domain-containing protein [Arthrobacter oryzae]WLQ07556.1 ANTAR domain-containing protein [Arthrobacter oryzae]
MAEKLPLDELSGAIGRIRRLLLRDMVNRACGILVQRQGFGYERALEELIRLAKRGRMTLAEASVEIIAAMPGGRD